MDKEREERRKKNNITYRELGEECNMSTNQAYLYFKGYKGGRADELRADLVGEVYDMVEEIILRRRACEQQKNVCKDDRRTEGRT